MVIEELSEHMVSDALSPPRWKTLALRCILLVGAGSVHLSIRQVRAQIASLEELLEAAVLPPWILVTSDTTRRTRGLISLYIPVAATLSAVIGMLQYITLIKTVTRPWRPCIRLVGPNVPTVDVIMTVCREPIDVVRDTVRATLNIDYPTDRYRVIVSDDGSSAELKDWILWLQTSHPNLCYTARSKQGPAGYKAGNLNHALEYANTLPGSCAGIVAGLDIDMIPEARWLRHIVPHLLRDPSIGVICPAQVRYYPISLI